MVSAWGLTETAPLATDCHFQAERSGNIGVPVPGIEVKLVPNDDKLEIRVRGPNVTPGYWKQPELTKAAFDEEGFYITGDAVRLADPKRPERGLYFDGRVVEDFKLSSGTMVHVGQLRIEGIAALDPIAQDIVVILSPFLYTLTWPRVAGLPASATKRPYVMCSTIRKCAPMLGKGSLCSKTEVADPRATRRERGYWRRRPRSIEGKSPTRDTLISEPLLAIGLKM
jgi:long-subunit acyl-CoA synthetase (AMP-forming)